jgi:hypothetical protein
MRLILMLSLIASICDGQNLTTTEGPAGTMHKNDLNKYGVGLIIPTDAEFGIAADRVLMPHGGDIAPIMKPISVVIENRSGKHIIGYAILWKFVQQSGATVAKQAIFIEPASLADGSRLKRFINHPASASIPQGSERLVSILGSIGAATNLAGFHNSQLQQQAASFAALMEQSKEINVTLDGILFDDGSFAGPNHTHFFESIVKTFDAVQDFNRHVLQLASEHRSDSEIVQWVTQQKNSSAGFSEMSGAEVFAAASEFLAVTDRSGVPAAIRVIQEKTYSLRPAFVNKGE